MTRKTNYYSWLITISLVPMKKKKKKIASFFPPWNLAFLGQLKQMEIHI